MLDDRFPNNTDVDTLRMRFDIKVACTDMINDVEKHLLSHEFRLVCAELGKGVSFAEMAKNYLAFKSELVDAMVEHLENRN